MKTIGIAIATFGDDLWRDMAVSAYRSAQATSADQIVTVHGSTLAKARNEAAQKLSTDLIIFLDADDLLDKHYVDVLRSNLRDGKVLYQPATLGLHPSGAFDDSACLIPDRGIFTSNHLVIGTACSREDMLRLGGFDELQVLEDWDLWIRMILDGAKVLSLSDMIYVVRVNNSGRNNANSKVMSSTHRLIQQRYRKQRGSIDSYTLD